MKTIIYRTLLIVVTLGISSCATYAPEDIRRNIEIVDYGTYSHEEVRIEEQVQASYGEKIISTNHKLIEKTNVIKLKKDVIFGLRFCIENERKFNIPAKLRIVLPEPGLYDPSKNEVITEFVENITLKNK